jgi:hypothetical protein
VFEIGERPKFLFVIAGGSGLGEEEYLLRSWSVIPIFDPLMSWLSERSLELIMVYISAPYDVPFARFATEPAAAAAWNAHLATELLEPWCGWPYFVCGFSGGAALVLNGFHQDRCCFGGATLGADALSSDFVCPEHWQEKLQLYATRHDRICNHPKNRSVVERLLERGQAEQVLLPSGGHHFSDYATIDGLGTLLSFAHKIAPVRSG